MDPKPTFESTTRPIPANTTHDPISPSATAPNPIGVRKSPMDEPGRLRDVPGGPFDSSAADKR